MGKIRFGVICPSEIAIRRFMPALKQLSDKCEFVGVAIADRTEWGSSWSDEILSLERKKAENFVIQYGGKVFDGYSNLISSPEIDAIYLPLPPALHCRWGIEVLESGKHLFVEKPSATTLEDCKTLVGFAKVNNLAIHENYMFQFHSQIEWIKNFVASGKIGDLRLVRINFGFPKRPAGDFRYLKAMGGGSLLDCGGYTLKLATMILGESVKVVCSKLNYVDEYDVDLFGSATVMNDEGLVANLSFGMDNAYKCELELWGSRGTLYTNRVLTAPVGFEPLIEYKDGNNPVERITLSSDDTFSKSIEYFLACIDEVKTREESMESILRQASLIQQIMEQN